MSKAVCGREADSTLPFAGCSCFKDWQFRALSSTCFSFCSSLALTVWQWWVTSYLVQPVCLSQVNLMLFRTCSNFGALLHSQRKFSSCFVNPLKPSGHYIRVCTTSLTFTNSTFCTHILFMCFKWIWKQTAIISLCSINWLVFITGAESVYCAVRA
jgi:hypothetical protein